MAQAAREKDTKQSALSLDNLTVSPYSVFFFVNILKKGFSLMFMFW